MGETDMAESGGGCARATRPDGGSNVQPGQEAVPRGGLQPAGFGPCKGCHVGGGRPQFHKRNTSEHAFPQQF